MSPESLMRLGAASACLGGGLRIAAAFIPYTEGSLPLEAFYALIDITLLLGLIAFYVRVAEKLHILGLLAFLVTFTGLASIVGPDAKLAGIEFYALGSQLIVLGLSVLSIQLLRAAEAIPAALLWLATLLAGLAAPLAPDMPLFPLAGILLGLGFIAAGLSGVLTRKA